MSIDTPLDETGSLLHDQMLAGDPTAPARIAEAFWPVLTERLRRHFPSLPDQDMIETAVGDALMSYFARPEQYDPRRLGLEAYLYMSSRGDLLNALQKSRSWVEKQISLGSDVEHQGESSEYTVEIPAPDDVEETVLAEVSVVRERLDVLFPNQVDRELVELILDGERHTDEYAIVLGIMDLEPEERAKIVKRHKDRLKKMIQRHQTEILGHE